MEIDEFEELMITLSKPRKVREVEQVEDETGKVVKKVIHIREVPENPDAVRYLIGKYGGGTAVASKARQLTLGER